MHDILSQEQIDELLKIFEKDYSEREILLKQFSERILQIDILNQDQIDTLSEKEFSERTIKLDILNQEQIDELLTIFQKEFSESEREILLKEFSKQKVHSHIILEKNTETHEETDSLINTCDILTPEEIHNLLCPIGIHDTTEEGENLIKEIDFLTTEEIDNIIKSSE